MRILERSYESSQSLPKFADVFGGLGKKVRIIDLRITQPAQLVNGDLEAVLVLVEKAFDLEEIILLEGVEGVLNVVPHFGFDLPSAVAQGESEIRFSGLFRLYL